MSNELLEICKRLEEDSIVSPTGHFLVTKAEQVNGGWELRVVKQQEAQTDDK